MKDIIFHRRNLPHLYIPCSTYFITFRIKNSISLKSIVKLHHKYERLRNIYRSKDYLNEDLFFEYDSLLDNSERNKYLINKELAQLVKNEIHKYDGKEYKLLCYSIMPNHVHLIFHLNDNSRCVSKIMQAIKRVSAFRINQYLNTHGNFWQPESYDHIVRDYDELNKIIRYTLMNPVNAKIVDNWEEYEHNFLSETW